MSGVRRLYGDSRCGHRSMFALILGRMADDLRSFDRWFSEYEWPSAPCPVCMLGDLHPLKDSISMVTTAVYDRNEKAEDWEPDWDQGFFHGVLYCGRVACQEKVIVSGQYRTEFITPNEVERQLRLRYAIPAMPLMKPPTKTPDAVMEGIVDASRVVWTSPAGAANGLRRSVEALLDHQRVNKTAFNKQHKRYRLSLHQRIAAFEKRNHTAATALEAVKWLGNEGSHNSSLLTASHCVESADYLNHALRLLYDTTDAELVRKARAVNKARGVSRSRRTP